jgi:hypothetical protein
MFAFYLVWEGWQENSCRDTNEHANRTINDEDPLPRRSTCASLVEIFDSSVSN